MGVSTVPVLSEDDRAAFVDARGRRWTVEITAGTVFRVRELMGLDLMDPKAVSAGVCSNPSTALLAGAICAPALADAGVSLLDLFEACDGRTCAEASVAVLSALVKWFKRGCPDADSFERHCTHVQRELNAIIDLNLGGGLVVGMDETPEGDELRARFTDLVSTLRLSSRAEDAAAILDDLGAVERKILDRRQARRRSAWLERLNNVSQSQAPEDP